MYHTTMVKIVEKTKPGWAIPVDIKEEFVEFCAHIGAITQEDCAGALFIWQHLPAQIREYAKLQAKGAPIVDADFWDGLRRGIEVSVQALLESQKHNKRKKSAKSG